MSDKEERVCGICRRHFHGVFQNHSMSSCNGSLKMDRDKAESQNKRYREALESIRDHTMPPFTDIKWIYENHVVAKEALQSVGGEEK